MLLEVTPATSASIFTAAGEVMTSMLTMTGNFFQGLWSNPMGQIICVLGLVSAVIGLCTRLFLKKKHV